MVAFRFTPSRLYLLGDVMLEVKGVRTDEDMETDDAREREIDSVSSALTHDSVTPAENALSHLELRSSFSCLSPRSVAMTALITSCLKRPSSSSLQQIVDRSKRKRSSISRSQAKSSDLCSATDLFLYLVAASLFSWSIRGTCFVSEEVRCSELGRGTLLNNKKTQYTTLP